MRRSLSDSKAQITFHALTVRLEAMHNEIVRQARARPEVVVPDATARVARRLLAEIRRYLAQIACNRLLPTLSHGPRPGDIGDFRMRGKRPLTRTCGPTSPPKGEVK